MFPIYLSIVRYFVENQSLPYLLIGKKRDYTSHVWKVKAYTQKKRIVILISKFTFSLSTKGTHGNYTKKERANLIFPLLPKGMTHTHT